MATDMTQKLDPSTGYTCIACRLVFANPTLQRDHFQTEWHRYNVKRQVAELPPISCEVFESKVQQFQEAPSKRDKRKRNKAQAKQQQPVEDEDVDDDVVEADDDEEGFEYDESKALPSTSCLFCISKSATVEANLEHMTIHGFFIPDAEYCIDVEGLLGYLGMKVGCGGVCTLCNKRSKYFRSLDAVQKHMRDKQHCRFSIDDEAVIEYLDFYDYGSLLVDEGEDDDNVAINEGYSLILPSGATLGHRSLQRYYKQHLRLQEGEVRSAAQNRKAINAALGKYKALGWTGATGTVAVQKARDIRYMKHLYSKHWMQQGIKSNKLFKSRGRADQM